MSTPNLNKIRLELRLAHDSLGRRGLVPSDQNALTHAETLLAAYEALYLQHAKVLDLVRRLSDNPPSADSRRTGRTARMILRALIALSAGHDVAVVGASQQQALQMKVDIERHCRTWNIPYDGGPWRPHGDGLARDDDRDPLVRACTPETSLVGFRGVTLIDHFVIEKMERFAGVEAGGKVPQEVS